jgi:hypothetical protein
MVEYLFTERDFTFEMLSDSSVTDGGVYEMLKEWYYETKSEKNTDLMELH